jgi:hypothetical protein
MASFLLDFLPDLAIACYTLNGLNCFNSIIISILSGGSITDRPIIIFFEDLISTHGSFF